MKARLFGRLTPALEARRRLLQAVRPVLRTEAVSLSEAFGRVAARSVHAPGPVPSFNRATWDGFALRSVDVRTATARSPRLLRVVGEVFAEQTYDRRLGPGEAVAIATGGAVPRGADAVEIWEEVRQSGRTVTISAPVSPGARIAPAGDDFAAGTLLVHADERLAPSGLGALAACGFSSVEVFARPIVAIVPNGNELREPGGRLRRGEIFESNNVALAAVLSACGAVPRPFAPVRDDPRAIAAVLRAALRTSDLVLATGGSSVGEHDHLPTIFPKLGRLLFHGVAVRPGKPTLAARAEGKLLVGLPGHPTSCLLNMHWMLLPAIRRLAHLPGPGWRVRTVRLTRAVAAPTPGFTTVVPLNVRGTSAAPTFHGSSAISSLRAANAFAILSPGGTRPGAGRSVRAFVLDPPLGPSPSG